MCHFTKYNRLAFLVVCLVTSDASRSMDSLAGEPHSGPKTNGKQAPPALEKRRGSATVGYWGEMHGIWAGTAGSKKNTEKRISDKPWGHIRMRFVIDFPTAKGNAGRESDKDRRQVADDETLAIHAASQGIRNVVLMVRRVSRVHEMYAHDSERSAVLIEHDQRFAPHVLPVMVGQLVTIQNRDATTMKIALPRSSQRQEMTRLLTPGDECVWRFKHAEFLPVVASTGNPSLSAYIVVVDNPYVGVSDDHGVIALANVPAGEELELRLWHERSGWLVLPNTTVTGQLRVTVPANGLLDLGEILVPAAALDRSSDVDPATQVASMKTLEYKDFIEVAISQ